jgi:hypothetical protein
MEKNKVAAEINALKISSEVKSSLMLIFTSQTMFRCIDGTGHSFYFAPVPNPTIENGTRKP